MNDIHIRKALKKILFNKYSKSKDTVIIEELGLGHGSTRIDLAVVNGFLHGFELKSDKDSLERLPHQAEMYSKVFDKITLIVGYRHAFKAIKIVPDWWEIKIAEEKRNDKIKIFTIRRNEKNPCLDKLFLAKLLWKEEALNLLKELGFEKGLKSKSREVIYKKLIDVTDIVHTHHLLLFSLILLSLLTNLLWMYNVY